MIPILLRPKLLALKNRWNREHNQDWAVARDLVLLAFACLVMFAIYYGTTLALRDIQTFGHLAYLSPFIPLAIMFMLLFVMLFISALVSSLGTLYLSRDLDLLLSSPLSPWRFFSGKFFHILYSTVWMPVVFIIPFVVAYGHIFNASNSYYAIAFLALIPYFLLPVALAMVVTTVFTAIIPASRSREVLIGVVLLFLLAIYGLAELVGWGTTNRNDIQQILKMLSMLSMPDQLWLPSHWVAMTLRDNLEHGEAVFSVELALLYSATLAAVGLSFAILTGLHSFAHARASNSQHGERLLDRILAHRFKSVADRFGPHFRAVFVKELKVFLREITQAVQLLLLMGVYLIYLYNLKVFQGLETLPIETQSVWRAFIFVLNVAMGAFITTAICTRFVFPSISFEGRSIWIINSSPVSLQNLMELKFWCWYIPIGIVSSLVFSSGAFAVGAGGWEILVNFLAGWIVSFGIVGLGMGLGASFAFFDWEHSSQLAASFGSLVYMLLSTMLITANMVPIGIMVFVRRPGMLGENMQDSQWLAVVGLCACFIVALNCFTKVWAMRVGEQRLRESLCS